MKVFFFVLMPPPLPPWQPSPSPSSYGKTLWPFPCEKSKAVTWGTRCDGVRPPGRRCGVATSSRRPIPPTVQKFATNCLDSSVIETRSAQTVKRPRRTATTFIVNILYLSWHVCDVHHSEVALAFVRRGFRLTDLYVNSVLGRSTFLVGFSELRSFCVFYERTFSCFKNGT